MRLPAALTWEPLGKHIIASKVALYFNQMANQLNLSCKFKYFHKYHQWIYKYCRAYAKWQEYGMVMKELDHQSIFTLAEIRYFCCIYMHVRMHACIYKNMVLLLHTHPKCTQMASYTTNTITKELKSNFKDNGVFVIDTPFSPHSFKVFHRKINK